MKKKYYQAKSCG